MGQCQNKTHLRPYCSKGTHLPQNYRVVPYHSAREGPTIYRPHQLDWDYWPYYSKGRIGLVSHKALGGLLQTDMHVRCVCSGTGRLLPFYRLGYLSPTGIEPVPMYR